MVFGPLSTNPQDFIEICSYFADLCYKLSYCTIFPDGEKSWIVIQNTQKTVEYNKIYIISFSLGHHQHINKILSKCISKLMSYSFLADRLLLTQLVVCHISVNTDHITQPMPSLAEIMIIKPAEYRHELIY